jgi:diaminopimelate decarboxylase
VAGTPYLVIHLARVRQNFRALRAALPDAEIRYAVKANPAEPILRLLAREGSAFDVASVGETNACASAGIDGGELTFGNPIKKASQVAYTHACGVRRFAFDTEDGLTTIADQAPGSGVECRVAPPFPPSVTPFGHKFGCAPRDAAQLLNFACQLGLHPEGLSFHVGSQQLDPSAWELGIRCVAPIFDIVGDLTTLNIGGGFPLAYAADAPGLDAIAETIASALKRHFGSTPPQLVVEPGRAIVGTLRGGVRADRYRWSALDLPRHRPLRRARRNRKRVHPVQTADQPRRRLGRRRCRCGADLRR